MKLEDFDTNGYRLEHDGPPPAPEGYQAIPLEECSGFVRWGLKPVELTQVPPPVGDRQWHQVEDRVPGQPQWELDLG